MRKRRVGVDVSEDRHYRYHLAARITSRSLTDVVIELLDYWSDDVIGQSSISRIQREEASRDESSTCGT